MAKPDRLVTRVLPALRCRRLDSQISSLACVSRLLGCLPACLQPFRAYVLTCACVFHVCLLDRWMAVQENEWLAGWLIYWTFVTILHFDVI